jgi:acyl-CoA thioester hydrolase
MEFTTTFPVKLNLRLDWSEMDLFGHINNVMYLKYIQASRVNYWEKTGMYRQFKEENIGPLLASVKCDFRKPLFYPGTIIIEAGLAFIGNTSFGLKHRILDEHGTIAAEGEDVIVYFNFNTNEKMTIPEYLREDFRKIEENK